ncbi:DUF2336 domain-containing protein [Deinococcus sp. QL22]|uniref:DUF2336 domain-containing protein n=1 Tax=Deinococcus sp. QL22 TaxID=2939437 RepID=UPI002016BCD9|nr:DUF2336 domain-containing protein [Deinococcus sp. QL22]UQN08776.1 DUF2336 domain-containing protein [Deinococcus sp. QL22]
MPREQTIPQTPIQEALNEQTSEARLFELACGMDAEVRRVAQGNSALAAPFRKVLQLAEQSPTELTPVQLDWLAGKGAFGRQVAANHPATTAATLNRMMQEGYTRLLLAGARGRSVATLVAAAQTDLAALHYLQTDRSVPLLLRTAAKRVSVLPSAAVPTDSADASLNTDADLLAQVRAKLLDRHTPPVLTVEEAKLLTANARLQRLAARHPLLSVPQLLWLDRTHPYGHARETLLRQLERNALEEDTFTEIAADSDAELRAAVARNPALPDLLRAQLREDQDSWVRGAVAENPNATPEDLTRLALDEGQAVVLEHVARHPHTPDAVLLRLVQGADPAVHLEVARNPSTPPEALALLASSHRYATREAVAAHPLTPPETVVALTADPHDRVALVARLRVGHGNEDTLNEALATRRRNVKLAISARTKLPEGVLVRLSQDRSPQVRAQAGLHPDLTELLRGRLLDDPDLSVARVTLATDTTASPEMLDALPRHDARIRRGLSRNPASPADVLNSLSDDALQEVRLSVVLNAAAPEGAIRRRLPEQPLRPVIRQHPLYERVRDELQQREYEEAAAPTASAEALSVLAQSDSAKVRRQVVRHPNTDEATLTLLTQDPSEEIRRTLASRPELPARLQRLLCIDSSLVVRTLLVRREDLDVQAMVDLASRPNEELSLLLSLTRHPQITAEVLARLAQHADADIREVVARHVRLPTTLQVRLASDPQDRVADAVFHNPSCTSEALEVLAVQPRRRLQVAKHPAASASVLERLAFDARYARFLRVRRVVSRLPARARELPPLQRWHEWSARQHSQRAFRDLNLLIAVIQHPAATDQAVRWAMRLEHPGIRAARQERRLRQQESMTNQTESQGNLPDRSTSENGTGENV